MLLWTSVLWCAAICPHPPPNKVLTVKKLLLALCFFSLFTLNCSNSTGPGDSGNEEHVTIGAEGGTAGSEAVEIDIPAGAFGDDVSIALSASPEQAFDENAVSGTYTITGLPLAYSKDLTVSIAYDGDLTDNSYIAVGVETWVSSLHETAMTYTLLPATVDGDLLTAELLATVFIPAKRADMEAEDSSPVTVTAVTGYKPYVTANGHFEIEYASRFTTLASVQQLGQYLEEAYTTIAGLGFSYDDRTNWPVSVTVKSMSKPDVYGYAMNSLWGDNYGYMEFNRDKMSDLAELRITAGHEFFHLVQAFYDPRNFYSKAKREAPHLWLDEASSVWIEELFTDQQDYASPTRAGNNLAPFNGVCPDDDEEADKHGYGLSAMIKYLVDNYGQSCLVNTYQALESGDDAITAMRKAAEDPIHWWDEFLRQYTQGDFYNVSLPELTANKSGMFQIIFDADSLATFTDDYRDLSGRLYLIRLENTYFDENAMLTVTADGDLSEVSVFKYRVNPREIELVGTDAESVSVSDLKALERDDWHLVALVSNTRNITPYTESTSITTTVRVTTPIDPGFTYFTLYTELVGDFVSTLSGSYTSTFHPAFSPAGWGALSGTSFTGSRNEPYGDGSIVGNYTITFDETFQNILTINAVQSKTSPGDEESGGSYHNVSFSAHGIPLAYVDDEVYVYQLTGSQITDQITSMTFEYGIDNDRHTELTGYRGGGGTSIIIRIWRRDQ